MVDCSVNNHNMTEANIILPLETIEEDIEEMDDTDDDSLEININESGKKIFIKRNSEDFLLT